MKLTMRSRSAHRLAASAAAAFSPWPSAPSSILMPGDRWSTAPGRGRDGGEIAVDTGRGSGGTAWRSGRRATAGRGRRSRSTTLAAVTCGMPAPFPESTPPTPGPPPGPWQSLPCRLPGWQTRLGSSSGAARRHRRRQRRPGDLPVGPGFGLGAWATGSPPASRVDSIGFRGSGSRVLLLPGPGPPAGAARPADSEPEPRSPGCHWHSLCAHDVERAWPGRPMGSFQVGMLKPSADDQVEP